MYSQFEAWYTPLGAIFQRIITFLHIVTTQQDKSVIFRLDIFDMLFEFPKQTFIHQIDIGSKMDVFKCLGNFKNYLNRKEPTLEIFKICKTFYEFSIKHVGICRQPI